MKVWIDQDLCTGDGLCEEIAPDVFFGKDDGLFYVKESVDNFGADKLFDGEANPAGSEGMARIPDGGLERVIESAEECPGRVHLHRGLAITAAPERPNDSGHRRPTPSHCSGWS